MLVKFFKQGLKGGGNTSSKSVKDYLLDSRANKGMARIIRGDEMHTSRQIDLLDYANASSTYTSGCLSFDESETLDEKQKQELMVSFEEALLPNFDATRYACYWVEHTDKGRLELNFVFAKIDLQTGKHLDVYQQRRDVARLNYWKEIQLQKHGLSDPNAPKHERDFLITPFKKPDGSTPHDKFKQQKEEIHQYISGSITKGDVTNASDVKRYIEYVHGDMNHPTGYRVKQNKTGIVVTDTTTEQTFRIQGKIYAKSFTLEEHQAGQPRGLNRIEDDRAKRQADYDRQKHQRLRTASERFATLCSLRARELHKKYGNEQTAQSSTQAIHTRDDATLDRDWGIDRETSLGSSAGDHHHDTKIVGGLDHVSIQPTGADLNPASNRHGARVRPTQTSRDKNKDEKKQQTSDTREPRTNDSPSSQADASRPLWLFKQCRDLIAWIYRKLAKRHEQRRGRLEGCTQRVATSRDRVAQYSKDVGADQKLIETYHQQNSQIIDKSSNTKPLIDQADQRACDSKRAVDQANSYINSTQQRRESIARKRASIIEQAGTTVDEIAQQSQTGLQHSQGQLRQSEDWLSNHHQQATADDIALRATADTKRQRDFNLADCLDRANRAGGRLVDDAWEFTRQCDMAKQSIKTIRDKVVTLKLYRADTEEALTEDDMQKLAYDTPIMELTPMVTHALNHKKDRDYAMKR